MLKDKMDKLFVPFGYGFYIICFLYLLMFASNMWYGPSRFSYALLFMLLLLNVFLIEWQKKIHKELFLREV